MFTCDKCGARLADGLKYCNKCGSQVNETSESNADFVGLNDIKPLEEPRVKDKTGFGLYLDNVISFLPHPLSNKGDRTALMIGQASVILLALIYIICFFAFMSEMCMPLSIGIVADYSGSLGGIKEGANSLWMLFYFLFNLSPAFFACISFFNKKYRMYALYSSIFFFALTLFTLICWSACEAGTIIESIDTYQNAGSIAWYALIDSLSEVWYLKMIFSISSVFGIGVDYIINKGK